MTGPADRPVTMEDRLRQALNEHAATVPEPPDRWDDVERRAAVARHAGTGRTGRRRAGGLAITALAAAVALVVLASVLRPDPKRRLLTTQTAGPTTTAGSGPTTTAVAGPGPISGPVPTSGPGPTARPAVPTSASTAAPGSGYQPLWPFHSLQDVRAWQSSYQSGGHSPWHLDPGQTALGFAAYLGYTNIDTVINTKIDGKGAHVTVGFPLPDGQPGDPPRSAAVVHLVRFGTGGDAPWEAVGTEDSPDFSLTTPRYGATVASPVSVGGRVSGLEIRIKLQVRQQSSTAPLGEFCCGAAVAGLGVPWTSAVSFQGATDGVVTIAAAMGGGLAAVEHFAVTGGRTNGASGPTPGL